jgi:trimethylguanosine synthase
MTKNNCKHHHLPHGDNGDGVLNPHPTSSVPDKFWAQRKRLFSRYDMGIRIGGGIDDEDKDVSSEMWYSVTPESIANHITERMMNIILYQKESQWMVEMTRRAENDRGICEKWENGEAIALENNEAERCKPPQRTQNNIIILDLFCGCGGNSIAFARWNNKHARKEDGEGRHEDGGDDDYYAGRPPRIKVIAVDNNLSRLKNAAHNASIYEVKCEDIIFVHADAVEVMHQYSKGALRVSSCGKGESYDEVREKICQLGYSEYAGFTIGGMELLPENIDGIFLSPPWGGMSYVSTTFDPAASIIVESSISEETSQQDENRNTEEGGNTNVTTNGAELLSIAIKALFGGTKEQQEQGVIAYFLPRNISGVAIGHNAAASGVVGCFEMEQNVVCGKVKTVTAYFGQGLNEKL